MSKAEMAKGAVNPTKADQANSTFKFTEKGQELYGTVEKVAIDIITDYGKASLIEVNDEDEGLVTLWLSQAQLKRGLVNGGNPLGRQVIEGDIVYIRFDGETKLDGGRTMKNFSVNLKAAEPVPASF